jgi:hypothetical protein
MLFVTVMILSFSVLIFPIMIILNYGDAQIKLENTKNIINPNMTGINQSRIDVLLNPNFTYFNETSNLPSYWSDPKDSCKGLFSCTIKFTDGWNDYVSFSLSTKNNTSHTWSSIYGQQIDVKSKGHYQLVTHMKLNNQSTQSHVKLEGFNETTKEWYQIKQCPPGKNGPLEWQEFSCVIIIPENTTKIRPVLYAGWSIIAGKEATTWFDAINLLTNVP